MFERIFRIPDLFLIDRVFDPVSAWLFKKFNVSNFMIARVVFAFECALLIWLLCVIYVDHASIQFVDPAFKSDVMSITMDMLFVFADSAFALYGFNTASRLARTQHLGKLPKDMRDGYTVEVILRRLFLGLVILLGPGKIIETIALHNYFNPAILRIVSNICIVIGFAFLGCTPRYPRSDRKRKQVSIFGPVALSNT